MAWQSLAVVTGGSRGIGRVIVGELSRSTPVLCISRSGWPVEKTKRGRFPIHALALDLSELTSLQNGLAEWIDGHPEYRVSSLILNAASLALGRLEDARPATIETVFRTNVFSAMTIVSCLAKRQAFRSSGSQITYVTSSLARFDPHLTFSGIGLYSATKAAVGRIAMVQAREFSLSHPHIRVARVHPGIVDTDMQNELRADGGLDPRFVEKTAGLPPYRPGDWQQAAPIDSLRTITAEMAADFVLWAAERGDHEATEFDYYAASAYHAVRDKRLATRRAMETDEVTA